MQRWLRRHGHQGDECTCELCQPPDDSLSSEAKVNFWAAILDAAEGRAFLLEDLDATS